MLRDFCFYPVRMLTESLLLLLYLWVMKTVCKQTLLRADVQKPPTILLLVSSLPGRENAALSIQPKVCPIWKERYKKKGRLRSLKVTLDTYQHILRA